MSPSVDQLADFLTMRSEARAYDLGAEVVGMIEREFGESAVCFAAIVAQAMVERFGLLPEEVAP